MENHGHDARSSAGYAANGVWGGMVSCAPIANRGKWRVTNGYQPAAGYQPASQRHKHIRKLLQLGASFISCRQSFTLAVSPIVYEECRQGDPAMAEKRLAILRDASLLPANPVILETAGPVRVAARTTSARPGSRVTIFLSKPSLRRERAAGRRR